MNLRRKTQNVVNGDAPPSSPPLIYATTNIDIRGLTRKQVHQRLITFGAIPVDNITSDTYYLLTGFGVGQNKLKAAAKFRIKVINIIDIL